MDKQTAKALIRRVENLEKAVASLGSAPRKHEEPVGDARAAAQESDSGGAGFYSKLRGAPSKGEETRHQDRESTPKWERWLKRIGIVAGIAYTIITYYLWKDARDNFIADQRAWVSVIDLHVAKEPAVGEELQITFTLVNSGKTPAIGVTGKHVVDIKPPEPAAPDWSKVAVANRLDIFPGANSTDNRAKAAGPSITAPIVNSYGGLATRLYIRVRVDYSDAFGKPHWTELCGFHVSGDNLSRFEACSIGLAVDGEPRK